MSRQYLVTGGCGFIGGHLCRALASAGAAVTVLDDLSNGDPAVLPAGARLVRGDICDPAALGEAVADADAVFHLAAISSVEACSADRAGTRRVNLGGTEALLAASGQRPVVFTSSAAVYGDQPVQPVSEAARLSPISPYAEDKAAAENRLRDAALARGFGAVALRPFNVFGTGQRRGSPYSGVITVFAERALAGLPLRINGDGGQTRDFVDVADVVLALRAAMDFAAGTDAARFEAVNVCSGRALSVLDLARTVARLAGSAAPVSFGPARAGDIRHSRGDPAKAERLLGVGTRVSVEDGLRRLVDGMGPAVPAPQAGQ